ncbi:hypothetical protein ANTQUA_LOCUS5213 [Anthophora quadrimaculata]
MSKKQVYLNVTATISFIQHEIVKLIKRFKFEELETSIMPIFPEVSWNNIRSELVKTHSKFTSANVAQLIKIAMIEAKLDLKVLRDRWSTLQLIDTSWHSKRKVWCGYSLIGSNKSTNYFISRKVQSQIQNYFNCSNMKVTVKVNTHNGITYACVIDDSRGIKKRRSYFFALFMDQKYIFCPKGNFLSAVLNGIVKSLGYKNCKRFKLMGRDLESLNRLCWQKKEGAISSENINQTLMYKDVSPERRKTGVDFTQQKHRKRYMEKCFGEDPPTLELLVINGPSMPVKSASTKLPNENIRATWEFRSHNIATYLTKLIERRILITPVPYYISNLMILGKNELTLQRD